MSTELERLVVAIEERSRRLAESDGIADEEIVRLAEELSRLAGDAVVELNRSMRANAPKTDPPGQGRLPVDS